MRFENKQLFQKAFSSNVKKIKQEEYISSDEINSSWNELEKRLPSTFIPQNGVHNRSSVQKRLLLITSIAGCVLLIITFSFWQIYNTANNTTKKGNYSIENQIQELYVPYGKSMEILLSDGTKVYANAGSRIVYPFVFHKDKREITVEGEAYIEVAHNPRIPFIVKANGFDVRVLGTKFNICGYPNEKSASVVLVQGSVQITTEKKQKILLQPNEMVIVTPEGTHSVQQVDVRKYISWKDHFILLDDEKLSVILKRLSTYYGMNFRCDAAVANLRLSGKLNIDNSVQEAIHILHKTAKLEYMEEENGYRFYERE